MRVAQLDGRFLLTRVLGRGGTGVVYRAHDRTSGRMVALKLARGTARSRLASEFDVWSRLKHPGIVRAYEFAVVRRGPFPAGTPYLVLEHVPLGVPGRPELRPGRMQPAQLEALALQMLGALGHVHEAGWVHRDLKPANLLASIGTGRWPRFKLTDFGLATRIGASSPLGTFSGSLAYVAPEALLGLPLDGRADLYGLGLLLYRMATGNLPVPIGEARAALRWHLAGPALDPARTRPSLSRQLVRFIRRLTRRDRDDRPDSACSALRLLGVNPGAAGSPPRAWPDPRCSTASGRPDAPGFAWRSPG